MPLTPDLPKVEVAIVEMANDFRRENNLALVKPDATLAKAARDYARFLTASSVFSHEADGRLPSDRIKAAGYEACNSAENLAWMLDSRGFETRDLARRMVEGWKGSPPHRRNLMLANVTDTGIAVAKYPNAEKYVAVQLLARPQSMKFSFEIDNRAGQPVGYSFAGTRRTLQARTKVRYTVCEPDDIVVEAKPGGLLTKAEAVRLRAEAGRTYRLSKGGGGEIKVEIGPALH